MIAISPLGRAAGPPGWRWMCWAAVLAVALWPTRADAGYTYRIDPGSATLPQGESPLFTVYLDATAGTAPVDVSGGFLVRLDLVDPATGLAPAGVGFYRGDVPGTNYIFQGNSIGFAVSYIDSTGNSTDPFGNPVIPPTPSIAFSDSPNLNTTVTLTPASSGVTSWALATFTIMNRSPSGGDVFINFNEAVTGVATGSGDPVDVVIPPSNGTPFHVNGDGTVTAVPAPPGAVLALLGAATMLATSRVRRSSNARPA